MLKLNLKREIVMDFVYTPEEMSVINNYADILAEIDEFCYNYDTSLEEFIGEEYNDSFVEFTRAFAENPVSVIQRLNDWID